MAERLNNIAYQQNPHHHHNHHSSSANFNPRSVSVDIRTPEELAAVNEFLVTLGRDVSGTSRHSHSNNNNFNPDTYFDAANLSQLGLSGMPGLPGANFSDGAYGGSGGPPYSGNNNYHSSRSSHPSVAPTSYGNMYMNDAPMNNYSPPSDYGQSGRRSSKYTGSSGSFSSGAHYHHPTPPLESSSPHSTVSTPINTTPPQVPMSMPDTFDYLRAPRGASSVAHLAPPEYMSKTMRPMIPLKSVPTAIAERPRVPVVPRQPLALSSPSAIASSSKLSSSKPGSLYPLLTSGDIQYKLPPLNRMYRSPSPPSRETSPTSSSTHSSPSTQPARLPGIHALARDMDEDEDDEEREHDHHLSRGVGSMELERSTSSMSQEERKRHAELILDLLVSINREFKSRYEYEDGHQEHGRGREREEGDVDMVSA